MANAQGTIMEFTYQGNTFGYGTPKETFNSGYTVATTTKATIAPFANFKANAFIGLSTVLFIGTFLAFAIARASARAFDRKIKSQYLLFDEDNAESKRTASRSSARSKGTDRRSERKEKSTKSQSTSKSQRSRSKSKTRELDSHRDLDTPAKSRSVSRSRKERHSSSRVMQEDEPPRRSSSRRKERDRDADYRRYYDDDF
jgi:hypothetical protein